MGRIVIFDLGKLSVLSANVTSEELARTYRLSNYHAAYLRLALRGGLPLASLDKDLLKVARRSDIEVYLK